MNVEILQGDSLDVMSLVMGDNSVDAIVTDPPYGLKFMGNHWDADVPSTELWREALRVLKPGGYLLAFFGTRTYHRGVVEIEDAGFEIRDCITWVYGQGFPKSLDVAKAIDKAAGAKQWRGWGTALKPASEPIVVARKPFPGTVAANVLQFGTGAINIDGCRVGDDVVGWGGARGGSDDPTQSKGRNYRLGEGEARPVGGRWPANLIHDGSLEVVAMFPDNNPGCKPHRVKSGAESVADLQAKGWGFSGSDKVAGFDDGDDLSAARFFYCAKPSKAERGEGNVHPTVKPVALMRYLCRLVTPPGGLILDPFTGSGTTGVAAVAEGFRFLGIEREAEYIEIARTRINQSRKVA